MPPPMCQAEPFGGCVYAVTDNGPPSTSRSLITTLVVVRTVSSSVVKVSVITVGGSLTAVTEMKTVAVSDPPKPSFTV